MLRIINLTPQNVHPFTSLKDRIETHPTTGLPSDHILLTASTFPTMSQNHNKNISSSLYVIAFQFHLPLSLSLSPLFISCLFLGISLSCPSPLPPLSPTLQSISLQWSGRLTAAPPEEYQSMLLWRQNQAPLLYFPPCFSFLPSTVLQ